MKKIRLQLSKVTVIVFVLLLLVSCGSANDSSGAGYDKMDIETTAANWDYAVGQEAGVSPEGEGFTDDGEDSYEEEDSGSGNDNIIYDSNDKIIRTINLNLETKAFDDLIKSIETQVDELGGYIESSRLTGRHYDSNNLRYGTIVARIPKETVNGFVNNLGGISNIIEKHENVDNVTLYYVDIESRTEALEIEQERLLSLLERAGDIEVIISLESRLTSVRYELQNLKTEIRTIDNKVDFSTITMDIQEVELMSVGIDTEESIGERISRGTQQTFRDLKEGFADFIVWLVVKLPYILIWVIIILVIVFIIRRVLKKKKFKNDLKHMNYDILNDDVPNDEQYEDNQKEDDIK